jgi:hypothetical protein
VPAAKRGTRNGKLGSLDVARKAIEQLSVLTGREIEGVLGLRRADDGWEVTLEVLELRRVPDSTDVLASYEVALDDQGELREYRRARRYARNQTEED